MIHQTHVFTLSIAFSNSVIMKLNLFALSKHEQVYMIVLYWKNIDIVAGPYILLTHTLDLNELWRKIWRYLIHERTVQWSRYVNASDESHATIVWAIVCATFEICLSALD